MAAAPFPDNEAQRLRELVACAVLDTPPEPAYDDLAELAAHVMEAPTALVSLLDEDRQWFKARVGLVASETPRSVSFCGHVVASSRTLVVRDASVDPRFADNPLVHGPLGIRFYAGAPIPGPNGTTFGTVCAIDYAPRAPSPAQIAMLESLGRQCAALLELRRASAERVEHETFFRLNLDLFCVSSFEGRFVTLNPAWSDLLGHPAEVLAGGSMLDLVHPEDREVVAQTCGRLATEGGSARIEARYRTADGGYRWLRWAARADTERARIYAVGRDDTQRRRLDALKSEFIATVSHELRTPLTSILGTLGLVEAGVVGELGPEAQELVTMAHASTERLVHLVNDLLDLEKLGAGRMILHRAPVPLPRLLREGVRGLEGLAGTRSIRLTLQEVPDVEIDADEGRILQVLNNLLGNACKFAPEGSEVRIAAEHTADGVRVSVIDRGAGIPMEAHATIFEPFGQLARSGGTGLGLSIARSIVELHGGRLGLDSVVGRGSTFWFELPRG